VTGPSPSADTYATGGGGEAASTKMGSTSALKRLKNGKLARPTPSPAAQPPIRCPECGCQRVWKDGWRRLRDGCRVQRYLCRDCGFRFSDTTHSKIKINIARQGLILPETVKDLRNLNVVDRLSINEGLKDSSFTFGEDVGSHTFTITGKDINSLLHNNRERRVGASAREAKNLAEVESRTMKWAAGATLKPSEAEVKGKIIEYLWYLKKQGYAESTVDTYVRILKTLYLRGANIYDPESVKKVIALQDWSKGRKWNVVKAYTLFLKMHGLTWDKPRYKPVEKLPFIPTEREIDEIIAGCSQQLATFLQVAKETGARRGEIFSLKWTDVDLVNRTIRITPEKGGEPRIFRISEKLAVMLSRLPKTSNRVWKHKSAKNLERQFRRERKRLAHKIGNLRILQIHFHTLRHWKATIEYARTKDILYVQKLLGHRSLKTTLRYTQLVNLPHREEYICKAAKTVKEAKELIEAGFEYVTEMNGVKLFKKLKTTFIGSVPSPS